MKKVLLIVLMYNSNPNFQIFLGKCSVNVMVNMVVSMVISIVISVIINGSKRGTFNHINV